MAVKKATDALVDAAKPTSGAVADDTTKIVVHYASIYSAVQCQSSWIYPHL